MTAPAWANDLTTIYDNPTSTTGFTALGGGASGLPTSGETDFYIQSSTCMSKAAWTNAIKGFIYANGGGTPTTFSVPTDGAIIAWCFYAADASLQTRQPAANSPGGLMVIVGNSTSAYYRFNVGGSDTLAFDKWVPYAVNPDNSLHDGGTVGSPSGTEGYVGIEANLPTTAGPTKGNPIAQDAVRYGRCQLDYTFGDAGNGYNTFAGAEGNQNAVSVRSGLIELINGAYLVQGFHRFGITGGNLVDFRDSNKKLFIRNNNGHVTSAFNRFEIQNASSNIAWTNIDIASLDPASRGTFVVTDNPTVTLVGGSFTDMGTFALDTNCDFDGTIFRRCLAVTAAGATLNNCTFATSDVAADGSAVIWNVATDTNGLLDGTTWSKGTNAHHAIELGTNSPTSVTFTDVNFGTSWNASNGQNDSTFYVKRTTGTVTINLVGCSGTFTYKTDGATVTVQQSVTLSIKVQDESKSPIQNAQTSIYLANSPFTELLNTDTNASGIASTGYNYGGSPVDVVIHVRKSELTDSPRYIAFSDTDQITANGLTRTVTLRPNPVLN